MSARTVIAADGVVDAEIVRTAGDLRAFDLGRLIWFQCEPFDNTGVRATVYGELRQVHATLDTVTVALAGVTHDEGGYHEVELDHHVEIGFVVQDYDTAPF